MTPVRILLVEDNPGDARLTQEAFKDSRVYNELSTVVDGEQALDYLFKRNGYEDIILPDIVLLDLNLPKIDGREVLEQIKQDPVVKLIPVIVLTTSEAETDIIRMYKLHANAYIKKPVDFNQFLVAVRSLENFWLMVVKLPPTEE